MLKLSPPGLLHWQGWPWGRADEMVPVAAFSTKNSEGFESAAAGCPIVNPFQHLRGQISKIPFLVGAYTMEGT